MVHDATDRLKTTWTDFTKHLALQELKFVPIFTGKLTKHGGDR